MAGGVDDGLAWYVAGPAPSTPGGGGPLPVPRLSPVRVLHVAPYFPPTWAYGGIPRIVYGLARELASRKHPQTVWTTDAFDGRRRADVPRERNLEGIRVLVSPNLSNRLAYRHQLFLPLLAGDRLRSVGQVDVMHLHGHRHLLNTAAVAWARRHGVPWVLTPNGTLPRHEKKVELKLLWDSLFASHVPAGAGRVVAVSNAEVGQLLAAGVPAERVARVPNGLMLDEFADLPPKGAFKSRHGLEGRRLVAYLGQISPRKGVEHLVAAFADGAIADATLVVGGNDMGALARAQAAANPTVLFTGLLEGRDRLALLVDADVLVYPSSDEVFGLVPFEGLLCGTPVVVGGDCGCGELIGEAGAGLLVRHADVDGLRMRIRTLLDDERAARAMVKRGVRYIEERLSFQRVAELYVDVYQEVVAEAVTRRVRAG